MQFDWLVCMIALLLPLGLAADEFLTVNTCEDAAEWQGAELETTLVKEGSGAIRWVPTQSAGMSTTAVPEDWTAGNCLQLWMHSAEATGSRFWIIISSENPEQEGPDYFSIALRADWEGWKQLTIPFDVIGRTRQPIGWHKIGRFQLHCSWDQSSVPSPEDVLILDGIRVVTLATEGQRLTDAEFFGAMNLERPGLDAVKAAVDAEDYTAAKAAFREYFLARRDVKWFDNWWERGPIPETRPNTSRADETIQHVYNFDRGRYELGADIDWNSNQRDEGEAATIEWNAALNRHFFFAYLADAYEGTLEDKYAAEIRDMMLGWIDQAPLLVFSSGNSPYHFAWETLNTAVRAGDTWIDAIWKTADAGAWDADSLCAVLKSLVEHARHLRKWPSRGNWLTAESKALTIVGTLLPEMQEADAWRETGIDRLYTQMAEEIYPDGIENELALGYGMWVLRNYCNIYDLALLNGRDDEIPDDYKSLIERMYNYVLYATGPDGLVPGLNDSGNSRAASILPPGFAYFPHRKDFQWIITNRAEGEQPAQTSYAFDYSGHYVLRSDWQPDARFLFFDAGPFGSGHQHEDKLTFTMQAYGREWIVEGGSYMYDKSRWRRYVLSTRGHNTTRIDGQDQSRRRARGTWVLRPPFEPLGNPWVSNDGFDYVSGVYESGYGSDPLVAVRHQREVLFVKPDYWVIVDTFEPEDDAEHEYETIFHINADEALADGTRVQAEADGQRLDILGFGSSLGVDVVKGIEEEPVQGWANYPWRAVPTALFRNRTAGRVRNVYVLYPSENRANAVEADLVQADEAGQMALRLSPGSGETHYIVKLNKDRAAGAPVTLGPVTTDSDLAVVKVRADGTVAGVSSVGGSLVEYDAR